MADSRQLSIKRLMIATACFAGAAGCFAWARYFATNPGQVHDHVVVALVFAIPALILAGVVCLAARVRTALAVSAVAFGFLVLMGVVANAVVPMLK